MTQFQPPIDLPDAYKPLPPAAAPWSAAAVSGIVLSVVGCLGVTAVMGLIFGIVGIYRTRGGVRRGRGLAIAAIPISVVTGLISVVPMFFLVLAVHTTELSDRIPQVFTADRAHAAEAVSIVREFASSEFNESVSDDRLLAWLDQVRATHGKLVQIEQPAAVPGSSGKLELSFETKFINGTSNIFVAVKIKGLQMKLNNISVGGLSPRDAD